MTKADKRARKKQHRDQEMAQRVAAARRRRLIRIAGLAVVFALVAGLAYAGRESGEGRTPDRAGGDQQDGPPECDRGRPPEAEPQQYDRPPPPSLEPGVDLGALIETSCGDISVDLLEERAPRTVNNFVFLAREGFYDGLTWHRVVDGFVIQAGDPNGIGTEEPNGAGYTIPDELPEKGRDYRFGTMAMANSGPDTQSSQFFIVANDEGPPGLDPIFSIFGQADEASKETILDIAARPTLQSADPARADQPRVPVYIESIEITER